MYHTRVLLKPEQRRKLEEIARREGRSISSVIGRAIDMGLEAVEIEAELWQKRARILSDLRAKREKQPFEYSGDLMGGARQGREDEGDQVFD